MVKPALAVSSPGHNPPSADPGTDRTTRPSPARRLNRRGPTEQFRVSSPPARGTRDRTQIQLIGTAITFVDLGHRAARNGGSVRARCEGLRYGPEPFGHTTDDAQPRSQTVMTCSEPSSADWKACWRQPLGSSNLPSCSACGYQWITWCSIKVWSATLADLPTRSDPLDDLAASSWRASGQDHARPAQDDCHAAGAVARLQETQRNG